ncbi:MULTISPECIES: uracil-DNA glycosylase [Pontibacter]|uniref:Uracil-DNA glycosylase n=1 Tax=Pontibacter lucknowensis TaxID=1077936 RepID=A0A1N7ARP8_9BACT|nr:MULTISPECIES: uracil-DNA glycosylase [Pontibacter]EJF10633.1 uracil-DNA glycosylase [Pontibacter sp. BAB1700]SIR41658.1 Uracil-DNA glycosylase [Pontibacter lucknowensis]
MNVKIEESWQNILQEEFEKPYFKDLVSFVKDEYTSQKVYPPGNQIFNAFERCPFDQVKVVILGQDPYHGPNQANGLAFSVKDGIRIPPSLINIFKEIRSDLGKDLPATGNLERWAEQGVLLLNATLTVRAGDAGSHQKKGWEEFTDAVVRKVNDLKTGVVFMLWGAYAQKKGAFIDESKHLVLKAAHPSPFAADRGFFGTRHFSKANEYLKQQGKEPIDW